MESYNAWLESLGVSNSWVILGAICLSIVLGYFVYTYFFKEEKTDFNSVQCCF